MCRFFVVFIVLAFVFSQNGLAQLPTGHPPVRELVEGVINTEHQVALVWSSKWLHVTQSVTYANLGEYNAPIEAKILSAAFKANDKVTILILLLDVKTQGCYIVTMKYQPLKGRFVAENAVIPTVNLANAQKIIGDAVYVLKNGSVFASWDTAKTWTIDSINIGKLTTTDISIDTNFYGWISTNQGVFYQHPDSNIWRKAVPIPGTFQNTTAIFVDRRNRIFVSRPGKVYFSTDRGLSWNDLSDGSIETITSFNDDAFGNIYAVGSGSKAYRLSNLSLPWISIADSINTQAYLPSTAKIVNSISGDSVLFAATRYGLFQSTDFGANWIPSPDAMQLPAHNFYTGVVKAKNYYFVSGSLGIYRIAVGDNVWEKVFPKQGFVWGINAFTTDSAGNLYGNFPIKIGPSTSLFYIVKSTDFGNTWVLDTAGQKALGITAGTQAFDYFVDKQGMQFLGGSGILYSKKTGQAWRRDTAGIGMKANEFIADVSLNNIKGVIYLCRRLGTFPTYSFGLYKRAIGDTIWQVVNTSSLSVSEGRMYSDNNGNIIIRTVGGNYKIWKYDGSNWTEIPLPTGIGSSVFAQTLTVDKSGVLWGAFFAGGFNQGVYFSTNNGTNWTYVGLQKVGINFLSSVDDTVYAVTIIDGIYSFTTSSKPASVNSKISQSATVYELFQNYPNPFNPTTNISFAIPKQSFVTIKIYDVLGRDVAVLLNKEMKEGIHSVGFNAEKLSSGVYFYRLQADNYVQTKKLILQK